MTDDTHAFEHRHSWTAAEVRLHARILTEARLEAMGSIIEGGSRHSLAVRLPSGRPYEIFPKGVRSPYYLWILKTIFSASDDQALALVTFFKDEPAAIYLIHGSVFHRTDANLDRLVKNRDYIGKKSPAEYGLDLNAATLPLLERFRLEDVIGSLA